MTRFDIGSIIGAITGQGPGTSNGPAALMQQLVDRGKRLGASARQRVDDAERSRRRRKLPAEGRVTIEYSPNLDGDPDPGEVVWAWVPFEEDPSQGKDRPVVIIGRRQGSLVGVPLTTRRNDREAQVVIGTGDWDSKQRVSYARIWRMLDLDADAVRREGAVLPRDKFDELIAAVDEYYETRQPGE